MLFGVALVGLLAFVHMAGSMQSSKYDYMKLEMLPRFSAKEFCSCLYVVGQEEKYCRKYISPKFNFGGVIIRLHWLVSTYIEDKGANVEGNDTKKTIRSQVLGWYNARAQFDSVSGCRLLF